jgi:hypothetical protein
MTGRSGSPVESRRARRCALPCACERRRLPGWARIALAASVALAAGLTSAQEAPSEARLRAKLAACLPGEDAVAGWKRVRGPAFYGPDTLYEYIDGAAGLYQSYDFERLAVADYQLGADTKQSIVVELYEMRTPLQAFGIYSVERAAHLKFERIGTEGYVSEGSCNFYKGRLYAKLAARQRDEATAQVVRQFARRVAAAAEGPAKPPAILKVIPSRARVEKSEHFIGAAVLGHDFLPNGFLADYNLGEKPSRLFLTLFPSEAEARAAYADLARFLREEGKMLGDRTGLGDEAMAGEEPFYGLTLACRKGSAVCGIVRIPEEESGRAVLKDLLANLKRAVREPAP